MRQGCYLFITITLALVTHNHLQAQQITTPAPPASLPAEPRRELPHRSGPAAPRRRSKQPSSNPPALSPTMPASTLSTAMSLSPTPTAASKRTTSSTTPTPANSPPPVTSSSPAAANTGAHPRLPRRLQPPHCHRALLRCLRLRRHPASRILAQTASTPPAIPSSSPAASSSRPATATMTSTTAPSPPASFPRPDWLLSSAHFNIDEDRAYARNSTFRLLNIPLLFLPYVTHPTDSDQRESGLLIPTIGQSTTRGLTLGEQFYLVLGRSSDLTVGADYYSSVGSAAECHLPLPRRRRRLRYPPLRSGRRHPPSAPRTRAEKKSFSPVAATRLNYPRRHQHRLPLQLHLPRGLHR